MTSEFAEAAASISAEALAAAARTIAAFQAEGMPHEVTLSSGVVLGLRPVPPFALQEALRQVRQPEPPMWLNPDKGREEPNGSDPDYLAAIDRYVETRLETIANVTMALGTDLKSVPEDMPGPDDDVWIEEMEVAAPALIIPRTPPRARYVAWLRYRAMPRTNDIAVVAALPLLLAGISEGEVAAAMASFPRDEERGGDPEPPAGGNGENGHRVRGARPRARGGDRGAGGSAV